MWIKNTDGKKDAMLTFSVLGFVFVLIKLMIAGVSISLGDAVYSFGDLDASSVAAVLTPTLGAYVGRRYTDKRFNRQTDEEVLEDILEDDTK